MQPLPTPGLLSLPDELIIHCLQCLSQQERFQHAVLVSKRFQRLCLAPQLLRTVTFHFSSDFARHGNSLLDFLTQNGEHVRRLQTGFCFISKDQQEAVRLLTACLAACSAAGKLEELHVGLDTPLTSTAWLAGLTACRQLRLGHSDIPLRLPPSLSRLTALTDADLAGRPIELGSTTAGLPPALTRLRLWDSFTTTLPRQLTSLSALESLDLFRESYAADGLALLARLPALRRLSLLTDDIPSSLPACLSTVTQLEQLVLSACIHDDSAVLAAMLPCLAGLTSLCLHFYTRLAGFAAIAQLPRLQRLRMKGYIYDEDATDAELQLPPGPWLRSIRWLGLPWPVLEAGVKLLRGAPQLEYLYSSGTPKYNIHASEAWRAFWQFVATHPPLRCLAFACEEGEEAESVPLMLFSVLLTLHHRRPGLQLRQLVEPLYGDTFLFEMTKCQGIPTGPGNFEAF